MSDSDSFIEEVSEEVRRDRLYHLVRRYGWIAATVIIVIVGGAAFNEWRKARAQAEAQAFGSALVNALEGPDEDARARALSGSIGTPEAAPVLRLLEASDRLSAEDPAAAAAALEQVVNDPSLDRIYTDLAALKLVMMGDDGVDTDRREQLLEQLAAPGSPYRPLAMEQQAIALAAVGELLAARNMAEAVLDEPGLTQPMLQRLAQLIVVLDAQSGAEDSE